MASFSNRSSCFLRRKQTAVPIRDQRCSRFLRQPVKVDLTTQGMIHHEGTQTVFGRVQSQGFA